MIIPAARGSRFASPRFVTAVFAALAFSLAAIPAAATHRVDQRFTVWGQVTYSDGTPAPGESVVVVVAAGRDAVRLRSDAEGWYRKVLAVENHDRGKVFDVRVRDLTEHVVVEFDAADVTTERGKRVDFVIRR